jgi:hypothetical protein
MRTIEMSHTIAYSEFILNTFDDNINCNLRMFQKIKIAKLDSHIDKHLYPTQHSVFK